MSADQQGRVRELMKQLKLHEAERTITDHLPIDPGECVRTLGVIERILVRLDPKEFHVLELAAAPAAFGKALSRRAVDARMKREDKELKRWVKVAE